MFPRDIYTLNEFVQCVESGLFIDDDGFGDILDGNLESMGIEIHPSAVMEPGFTWPEGAKHVDWFNK